MAKKKTLRERGLNPRALGTNPRALGTNPRALSMAKSNYPVGLLGHSLRPGSAVLVGWQFKVVAETKDGRYALQLFSWLSGDPTNIVFVSDADLTDVAKYRLYDSEQKWRDAADRSTEYDRRQHAQA